MASLFSAEKIKRLQSGLSSHLQTVILLILLTIGTSFGFYTIYVSNQHVIIQKEHAEITNLLVRKGELLNRILVSAGYGGFIHNFKTYIIRQDASVFEQAVVAYDSVANAIESYQLLALTDGESRSLQTISDTLAKYRQNLDLAKGLSEAGKSIQEIDNSVEVPGTNVIGAIIDLEKDWLALVISTEKKLQATLDTTYVITRHVLFSLLFLIALGCFSVWYLARMDIRRAMLHEALNQSEGRFREMVDFSADAIITISDAGLIETFNAKAQSLFGFSKEEAIQKNVSIIIPPDDRSNHDKYLSNEHTFAPKVINQPRGLNGYTKNGKTFPIELNIAPYWENGEKKFIGIIRDITKRKAAEEALASSLIEAKSASATKDRFLANVSHELRTPLNAIIGRADMISMGIYGKMSEPKYVEYIDDIRLASNHLLSVIGDILDLASIEEGSSELQLESVHLGTVLNEAIKFISLDLQKKDIELEFSQSSDEIYLTCDRRRTKQIFVNILANAVKYTESHGNIYVETDAHTAGFIKVRIRDTGIGIPGDKISSIHEPFVQHDSYLHLANQGTGLGLAITKHLVELHDGALSIKSQPGVGTEIECVFPGT